MAHRGIVKRRLITFRLDVDLTRELDRFKTEHQFASRTEAIRWLIKAALDAKLAPKGE